MIPAEIRREHIEAAMDEIDRTGVPAERRPRKFFVLRNEKRYPPKYVISIASRMAVRRELNPAEFNGGAQTNGFLRKLGYIIIRDNADPARIPSEPPPMGSTPASTVAQHNERCAECKQSVEQLLASLYGSVVRNARIQIPATPDGLRPSLVQETLREIYAELQEARGFSSFVRCETLPPCDFLVPNPGFIVEFDESQHFTSQRKLTLSLYPPDLHLGFDIVKWMQLCNQLQRHDNDPPFRDEQRAWFDTLRDFAPFIEKLMPTLRLYAGEFEWCRLDIDTFRQRLGELINFWRLEFRIPTRPKLARVVVDGSWRGNETVARKLLIDICNQWPSGLHVKCVSMPGAFLTFNWPKNIPHQPDNRFPSNDAIRQLDAEARTHVEKLLSGGLRERIAQFSDHLSIGIDTEKTKISSTNNHIGENHAELVYVVNLRTGALHFTGKSYPTSGQEKGLLRITDLASHFVDVDGEQAMVLGCHDLMMFNPRSDATAGRWRKETKDEFKRLASQKAPILVLHHPHTTVKRRTWQQGWSELLAYLPSVRSYVGTGCYSFRDKNGLSRDSLHDVLEATKSSDTIDIIAVMGGR